MATSIPEPTFGPLGFSPPTSQATLSGAQADVDAAFGGGLNPALNTPQGQLATSWAASVDDKNDQFVFLTNMFDPAFATGRYQDALARIYYITRKPALPTVVAATCVGGQGVNIPAGSLAQAEDGNIYTCTDGGTIDNTGSIVLNFSCNTLGPIACAAGSLNKIYRAIPGWDTIDNVADGVLGQNVESRAEFELRRGLSVAGNARNTNESVMGAVLDITSVLDAYVIDNEQGTTQTKGGVALVKNSIYVAAVGGTDAEVADAIWRKKPPGCDMNGSTVVTVTGSSTLYSPPLPQWTIKFVRPTPTPIFFQVNILNNALVPSDAVSQIQNAIIAAFAGADGGTRARIGSTILSLRYAAPIISLGTWAQIVSIQVGSSNTPSATFTGVIAGTSLTTSGVTGAVAVGQMITDATGNVLAGTKVTAGASSPWTINNTQTVASETMYGILVNRNDVVLNINQVPTINAANIAVTLV